MLSVIMPIVVFLFVVMITVTMPSVVKLIVKIQHRE
jgi:hypothetical protein